MPPEALRPRVLPTELPTDALVQRALGGDGRAFGALVLRYRPRILALCLQLTGSQAEAEDCAQEVFLRAFQNLSRFEGRSAFFTWLYRIAVNRSLEVLQQRRARGGVGLDDPRVALAVAVDASGDPQRAVQLRETYAQLVRAFDQLTPLLRTTVALTTLQGLSHAEAAAVLGTQEGTIGWRLHEAREQLRRALFPVASEPAEGVQAPSTGALIPRNRRPRVPQREDDSQITNLAFALASALSA
ncbi:MAG: sigma-70 family RNA polymerase sigma factor [Deltaproteobacteria bacterium]|nr:sigma-70 family RNA polymerase sigma factor [Deltaproteobacteria bacterium]